MGAMRRASFALLMVFAAACGGATVTTLDGSKDAGTDGSSADGGGCTEPQPDIGCKCCNQPTSLECVNGAWQCRACTLACNIDGGVPDAGHDAGPDSSFTCGPTTCDSTKEYCWVVGGGPPPLDGGSNETWTCESLPKDCHGTASCACVEADGGGNGCPCEADKTGAVTVECLYP